MSLPKTPSDPNVEWHVLLRGERRGPYTPTGLRDLLESHPDGWSASVWRPGMLDWRPAQQVEPLLQAARGAAHPLPREVVPAARLLEREPVPPITAELTALEHEPPRSPPPSQPSLPKIRAEAAFILTPSEDEVAMRAAQTRTRAAPLFAETTHEMPAYGRPRRSARTLYYLAAIGSLVLLSAFLLLSKWRSTSASTRVPPPLAVATQPAAPRAPEPSPPLPTTEPPVPAAAVQEQPHANVTRARVRARWAPVRAAADPDAKVLCSVPRGALLSVSGQRPGTHARWFAVQCDAQTGGWVHENFLASVR